MLGRDLPTTAFYIQTSNFLTKWLIFALLCLTLSFIIKIIGAIQQVTLTSPQIHNTENLKQIFPEKELLGLSPMQFPYSCVCERFINMIGLPILLQENMWSVDRSWEYINRSQTHECKNWD
jgi:hypothetical protein